MSSPRVFIAKYLPDVRRFEPRNIGVILWTPTGTAARFVAEKDGAPGEVDGRSVPSFVASTSAYKQWIEYWRRQIQCESVASLTDPARTAHCKDPTFLDVLSESSKGNFLLAESGFLLDPVQDLADAVGFLFDQLVDTGSVDDPRDPTLDEVCDRLIQEADLNAKPFFASNVDIPCKIDMNVTETFRFSHAVRNGSIKRLYQRIPFSSRESYLRKTVHDAAWMFDQVRKNAIVSEQNAVALIYTGSDIDSRVDVVWASGVLGTVSRVVDLDNREAALREFENLEAIVQD